MQSINASVSSLEDYVITSYISPAIKSTYRVHLLYASESRAYMQQGTISAASVWRSNIHRVSSRIYNRSPHEGLISIQQLDGDLGNGGTEKQEVSVSRVTFSRSARSRFLLSYFFSLSSLLYALECAPLALLSLLSSSACEVDSPSWLYDSRIRLGFILILKERRAAVPVLSRADSLRKISLTPSKRSRDRPSYYPNTSLFLVNQLIPSMVCIVEEIRNIKLRLRFTIDLQKMNKKKFESM